MATYKQVCYFDGLTRRLKKPAPTEDELAAFAALSREEASGKIDKLEQERDAVRAEPA